MKNIVTAQMAQRMALFFGETNQFVELRITEKGLVAVTVRSTTESYFTENFNKEVKYEGGYDPKRITTILFNPKHDWCIENGSRIISLMTFKHFGGMTTTIGHNSLTFYNDIIAFMKQNETK